MQASIQCKIVLYTSNLCRLRSHLLNFHKTNLQSLNIAKRVCRTDRFYQRQDSGVGTLTLRTETLWIPGTLTTRILIRPKELKHCFKVGCCGAQALHNSKEGSRGTQALHNDRIPGTLTTRILEGGRRTLTLHIGKERGVVELKHCTTI